MKTKFFIAALAGLLALGTVYASVNTADSKAAATEACSCADCSSCCGSSCSCE